MIKLYDYELSANCYKQRLMMSLLGVPYESIPVDFFPGLEHKSDEFKKINPLGHIPVIDDDGYMLWDAHAILVYLAAEYDPSGQWYPTGDPELLGETASWLLFAEGTTNTASAARLFVNLGYDFDIDACRTGAHRLFRVLDEHLWFRERAGLDWVCSPTHPTIADIAIFPDVVLSEEGGVSRLDYPRVTPLDRPRQNTARLHDHARRLPRRNQLSATLGRGQTMYVAELRDMSAGEIVAGFAAGRFSPLEVTKHALAVIEMTNPHVNCMYQVDTDGAVSTAQASTDRWAAGAPLSALDGVPTVVKDGLDASGWPNNRGSAATTGRSTLSEHDAPAVSRQRQAGMILLGKSTMCDYGMLASGLSSRFGPARNPWNLAANTSGSSSGTAASIAAGICQLAVGTDIVGSVRHPASFCGLVGLKPSQGRVPYMPPGAPSLCAGPLARNLDDLCLLMNLIAQPDHRDVTALVYGSVDYSALEALPLAGLTVGYVPDLGFGLALDAEVETQMDQAIEHLAAQGVAIRRLAPPFLPGDQKPVERFYQARYNAELCALPPGERDLSPVISPWARQANDHSATELFNDMKATAVLRGRTMAMIDGVDFLLLPTVPVPPYAADASGHDPDDFFVSRCNTFLFNITEQPCISIPCGLSDNGRPIGLQIVGARFDDVGVLRMAHSVAGLLEPLGPWPRPEAST